MKNIYWLIALIILPLLSACGGSGSPEKSTSGLSSAGQNSLPSVSSATSSISSASSSVASFDSLVISVSEKLIDEPLLEVSRFPEVVEAEDSLVLQWIAYSAEGFLNNVAWQQLSGPAVSLNPKNNQLVIKFDKPGDVSLRASVTDNQNRSISRDINIKVVAPFSEKARLISGSSTGIGFDLVIVGDGFLDLDQDKFNQAADETAEYLFQYDSKILGPYKPLVNIWAVESISTTREIPNSESGSTLLGSYFYCSGIDRLLCVDFAKTMQFVSQHVPQYDQIVVLVNSSRYGGAGGAISTASLHGLSKNIVIHELGHSLANLADEYVENDGQAPDGFEPFEPNVTINPDPKNAKWNYWYKDPEKILGVDHFAVQSMDIGFFEGGKYHSRGIWRPTEFSFMSDIGLPMGAVNAEAMALSIWNYSDNSLLVLPQQKIVSKSDKPTIFFIQPPLETNYLQIQWWINNELVTAKGNEIFLVLSQIDESIKSVRVQMTDSTGLIRRYSSESKAEFEWVVE